MTLPGDSRTRFSFEIPGQSFLAFFFFFWVKLIWMCFIKSLIKVDHMGPVNSHTEFTSNAYGWLTKCECFKNPMECYLKTKLLYRSSGGTCVQAVNTSNPESGGLEFKPCPSHCFLRQGSLLHFVSLHQVYKWVPATYCWGVTLQWSSIPSREA